MCLVKLIEYFKYYIYLASVLSKVKQVYEQLDSVIAKTPKKDIVVVQGIWNARVGPDA